MAVVTLPARHEPIGVRRRGSAREGGTTRVGANRLVYSVPTPSPLRPHSVPTPSPPRPHPVPKRHERGSRGSGKADRSSRAGLRAPLLARRFRRGRMRRMGQMRRITPPGRSEIRAPGRTALIGVVPAVARAPCLDIVEMPLRRAVPISCCSALAHGVRTATRKNPQHPLDPPHAYPTSRWPNSHHAHGSPSGAGSHPRLFREDPRPSRSPFRMRAHRASRIATTSPSAGSP